jgi:RecJ-like exonuclease
MPGKLMLLPLGVEWAGKIGARQVALLGSTLSVSLLLFSCSHSEINPDKGRFSQSLGLRHESKSDIPNEIVVDGTTRYKCKACGGAGCEICPDCNGRRYTIAAIKCVQCDGRGKSKAWWMLWLGNTACSECKGTGIAQSRVPCNKCGGSGKINCRDPKCNNGYKKSEIMSIDVIGKPPAKCAVCKGCKTFPCAKCGGCGQVMCISCHGLGSVHDTKQCMNCSGSGKVRNPWTLGIGKRDCSVCKGRGKIDYMRECSTCSATGKVKCNAIGCENGRVKCSECDGTGYAQ